MAFTRDIALLRHQLASSRRDAIQLFRENRRPESLLQNLRRIADRTLKSLVALHPLPPGATLVAVGGYGRGELYPFSDVDVLILLQEPPSAEATRYLEAFVAAMWDLGLEPSHSVRTIEDCTREAAADVTVETSLLESRWLEGDRKLMQALREAMSRQRNPRSFFQAKRAEMQQRHARFQDTAYALEPNCKESPGALRDLQVVLWMAQAAGMGSTWAEIARNDGLTSSELRALRRAELAFKRLRIELHLLAGRREDRLLFDLQPALAEIYGFEATKNRRPSELLMQRYYWAARVVCQLNSILLHTLEDRLFPLPVEQFQAIDEDFCAVRGRLAVRREDAFERNPALIFRAFLVMQEHSELTGVTAQTLRALWHARRRIDTQFRRNPVHRHQFIQILQQPRRVTQTLQRMTMLNILPRYLPVFRRVVGQMQHDLFHAYTVDQHTLLVIRNLRRFTLPEHAQEHPLASQLMADFEDPWLLYVAALFHDIAKGRGGDHSELGAQDVRRFCREHNIEGEQAQLCEFLVRHHLLMSMVAQKRDLSDPAVILEFAAQVGNERRLTALYLLTVADIRGTSPKVWNAWKGKLLETLFHLSLKALGTSQPDPGAVLARRKLDAQDEIRRFGLTDANREAFWSQMDVAYFLRHDASDIAWHTYHLHACVNTPEPVVKARVIGQNEALQVLVYTPDREDLFVSICRYFDEARYSVQDARVHTTHHGWALDSFIVLLLDAQADYHSYAALVQRELAASLREPSRTPCPETRLARKRSRRSRVFPIVPSVELQPDEHHLSWRLAITAADRPGLLHSLAKVFATHEVDLKMAKIMTLGDRVEDIFIVGGASLEQPRAQRQFERDILAALEAPFSV
ncbi:[protein-PII] uridylyltransferase [Achromobacter sp. F4_2707]|uniref:[protein-PII] uridylyltransferase n=1 Tax=Achromobacter sp. F4_2707 TaxID=3114286 RepID=UPI0039C5BB40